MNDAADTTPSTAQQTKSVVSRDHEAKKDAGAQVAPTASPQQNGDGRNNAHVDGKSDSEAETVVLPGKERNSSSPNHRSIKHEGNGDTKRPQQPKENGTTGSAAKNGRHNDTETNGTPSKSRKLNKDQNTTSSNLSSTKSSPVPEALGRSRAGSEESDNKGNNHVDGDDGSRSSQSRKRKSRAEDGEEKPVKRRHVAPGESEDGVNAPSESTERGVKKASSAGSESPPPRTRQRALSTRESHNATAQRRRKPPPLHVGTRNNYLDDDDGSSNGSTSPRIHAHLKRLTSADASATSPAKMGPYRRTRDKSGRTYLARMCDLGDLAAVRARLEERPEDLDEADNAKNTPLQIASLKGNDEIVKVLIEAGCKLDCRNVDNDTPLIDAVENGCFEVIKLLLKAGLDPHQKNARGEGLLDLIPHDNERFDDIKRVIVTAQKAERRQSKDGNQSQAGHNSASSRGFRDSSIHSPPPQSASRRRTARSDATRNDLLYITPDRATLRHASEIGDDETVHHILNMNPGAADNRSVLVAARGGHETTLELLVALGGAHIDPDPDPEALQGEKPSPLLRSTPMLVAIGGGKPGIVQLLLGLPGFNPTRRWEGKTYYEIARDRKQAHWEEEYKMLKEAYQKHKGAMSRSDSASSKRRSTEHSSSSGQAESKTSHHRTKPNAESRHGESHDGNPEANRHLSKKHLQVPSKASSREQSVAASDREASPARKNHEKTQNMSHSEAEIQDSEVPKPRKRLISKRDLKDSMKQRRSSIVSATSSSGLERLDSLHEKDASTKISLEEGMERPRSVRTELAKSRSKTHASSPGSRSPDTRRSPDESRKALPNKPSKEKAVPGRSVGSGAAGSNNSGSTKEKEGKENREAQKAHKPRTETSSTRARKSPAPSTSKPPSPPERHGTRENTPQKDTSDQLQREMNAATAEAERRKRKEPHSDQERGRSERSKANEITEHDGAVVSSDSSRKENIKRKASSTTDDPAVFKKSASDREIAERKAKFKQEESERKSKQDEADRKAKQEESERQAKALQDEAEKKAKAEKAEKARRAKVEQELAEQAAKAEREAEEARVQKQRHEEEQARRISERDRQRKEEEERHARRQREHEERERLAVERRQHEEEQRRLERLPNGLRHIAELGPEKAKSRLRMELWAGLKVAQLRQLDLNCEKSVEKELWISNVQVAALLGTSDIDLSQFTAWSKRLAKKNERIALWRLLQRQLQDMPIPRPKDWGDDGDAKVWKATWALWKKLTNVFWIRLSDFRDIIPRYPHLADITLYERLINIDGTPNPRTGQIWDGLPGDSPLVTDDYVLNEADTEQQGK